MTRKLGISFVITTFGLTLILTGCQKGADQNQIQKLQKQLAAAQSQIAELEKHRAALEQQYASKTKALQGKLALLEKRKQRQADPMWEKLDKMTVANLAKALADKTKLTVCDANREAVRKKFGVIPGALLLAGKTWDPAKVLPQDKAQQLVFYCSSTQCRASDKAATKAVKAGYKKVAVLRAGIKGWKEAGQKTVMPRS